MTRETADILRRAKARIGTPDKWHKGDYFEGIDSDTATAPFPDNCPACAYGAVMWAGGHDANVTPADIALREAARGMPREWPDVDIFNDHPDTTHADVMALFDRAIAAEEASQ